MTTRPKSAPRCAVIVGPYLSGKTTLLEAMLNGCGAVNRKGKVTDGNTVGDSAPEARARNMSVELNIATTEYLGDEWSFIDCPGSVELYQDALNAIQIADTAVVVVEPGHDKAMAATRIMKILDQQGTPYCIFINKMDHLEAKAAAEREEEKRLSREKMARQERAE